MEGFTIEQLGLFITLMGGTASAIIVACFKSRYIYIYYMDDDIEEIINIINDQMQLLIKHINTLTEDKNKLKEELEEIRVHISKFFDKV